MEYLPLPANNNTMKASRYNRAGSFIGRGSAAWIRVTAISMVMIKGIVANLVPKPAKINTEQNTSAKTASASESSALIPITGGNCTGAPDKSMSSLGMPWVNINVAIPALVNNRAMPVRLE